MQDDRINCGMGTLSRMGIIIAAIAAIPLSAHDVITTNVTWTKEISRIVYKRCAGCHVEKGRVMSLVTYADARPWAKAIRDEIANRRMPPWGPVPGIGHFRNDQSLSASEIDMLLTWVEGGAPEGDPAYLPALVPSVGATRLPAYRQAITVTGTRTLPATTTLLAVRSASASSPLELWATEPDGTVTRLIWIAQPSSLFRGPFVYEAPRKFSAGTKLTAKGKAVVYLK